MTSSKKDGGGVLIAVKDKFKTQRLLISDPGFELLLVKVFCEESSVVLGACYIPPNSKPEYYEKLIECLQTSLGDVLFVRDNVSSKFILVGDFNVPGFDWLTEYSCSTASGYHPNVNFREAAFLLSKWCQSYKLVQQNNIKNNFGNLLDLIFTNCYDALSEISDEFLLKCDEAHSPLSISFIIDKVTFNPRNLVVFNYKKANFSEISRQLNGVFIPSSVNDATSLNNFVSDLESKFSELINDFVPTFSVKTRSFPHWYSNELIAAIITKKRSHKLYKQYNSGYYFNCFKKDRAFAKLLATRDEKAYLKFTEDSIGNNSKHFFKYVNNLNSSSTIPSTLHLDGQVSDNLRDGANLFANKFSSVYRNLDLSNTVIPFEIRDSFCNISLGMVDIDECIDRLSSNGSPGPDKVHPLLVIKCRNEIKHWLLDLFNLSLKLGIFPLCWKVSYISPFFKGGDPTDINNYRPINKYKVFAKMFDYLVYIKSYPYFRKFITPHQHGFLEGRSTVTNLTVYSEFIHDNLNLNKVVDSIYIDFTRAFDLVNLNLLVRKLYAYGTTGTMLQWFDSYLSGRQQIVRLQNFVSYSFEVLSGVGQGTHLGPLLFLLFINDIVNNISYCNISLFADDTKLFKAIETPDDMLLLRLDVSSLEEWCSLNGMECNAKKCSTIRFGRNHMIPSVDYYINNSSLVRVEHVKDLGVIFDAKMSFKYHIEHLDIKMRKKFYFIKRFSFNFKSMLTFRTLYYSFIFSKLMYASTVWRPHEKGLIKKIESLNTLYLRYAAFKTGNAMHYTDHNFSSIYKLFNISTLESARDRADILFAFKILSGLIDCSELLYRFNFYIPPRSLRSNNYYFLNPTLRDGQKKSVVHRLSELCNVNATWLDLYCSSIFHVKSKSRNLLKYQ